VDRFILEAHWDYFIKNLSTEKKISEKGLGISNNKTEITGISADQGLKIRDNHRFPQFKQRLR
jgi:hypothetical protein